VRECRTCEFDTNWMSPTSRIMWSARRWQVSSRTCRASSWAGERGGMRPASEKRPWERT
jgi:hypothetical protein